MRKQSFIEEVTSLARHVRRYFFPEQPIHIQPSKLPLVDKVLYIACATDNVGMVRTLIASGHCKKNTLMMQDMTDHRGNYKITETPATVAARYGSARVLKALCQGDENTFVNDCHSHSPMYYAVKHNKPECVKVLLENGCDPCARYVAGAKLFDRCLVRFGSLYKLAMKQGGEVARLFQEEEPKWQLLHAVGNRETERVRQLLQDKTCDINFSDSYGKTPLMKAVYGEQYDIAKMLLENGADTEKKDVYGHAAVFHAHSMEMIQLLANHDAVLYEKRAGTGHALHEFMNCVLKDKSVLQTIADMAAKQKFNHMAMTKTRTPKLQKIVLPKKPDRKKLSKMEIVKKPPQTTSGNA